MKGSTMLATLQWLGVLPSFSRPRTSNDNCYSESLFKTLKYVPEYPEHPFATIEDARQWVHSFVTWYNIEHLHSGINFVTPDVRHGSKDAAILAERRKVYDSARSANPLRWKQGMRKWAFQSRVSINPDPPQIRADSELRHLS